MQKKPTQLIDTQWDVEEDVASPQTFHFNCLFIDKQKGEYDKMEWRL